MKPQRRPIEGAIVSGFDLMVLAEPDQFAKIPRDMAKHLHLYLICRRPRIGVVPEEFWAADDTCHVVFLAQYGDELRRIEVDTPNYLGMTDVQMRSEWPHSDFELLNSAGERLSWGRSSLLLTMVDGGNEHLDLEVLYVGQA